MITLREYLICFDDAKRQDIGHVRTLDLEVRVDNKLMQAGYRDVSDILEDILLLPKPKIPSIKGIGRTSMRQILRALRDKRYITTIDYERLIDELA